jgi:ParB-like chromosome segregation protein Spo0J
MKKGEYEITDWQKLCLPENWHPAANMFPLMSKSEEKEFEGLVSNLRIAGLLNPITLVEGKVLDGRNRLLACKEAGVTPRFVDWDKSGGSPAEWVVAQNVNRRSLTPSQKALASLYIIHNFQPTPEQKAKFTEGGTKWDKRLFICNMFGIDRHACSDIVAIEAWSLMKSDRKGWDNPSRPRPDVLEAIKNGDSIASTLRRIEFWIAQAKGSPATEQEMDECPTGQLAREFIKLIPQHIMVKAYDETLLWLEGEKRERLQKYWDRMDKEFTWCKEKS